MLKIGRVFAIFLILTSFLMARATIFVNAKEIQAGDVVQYTIESDQEEVEFPDIDKIAGYEILSAPASSSIQIINGKKTVKKTKTYIFKPFEDIVIPSYVVYENDKKITLPLIEIRVKKRTQTANEPYKFDIKVDKKQAFVGEEIELRAEFKISSSLRLESLDVDFEKLNGFWVKVQDDKWKGERRGDEVVYHKIFYFYPQKSGTLTIPSYPIDGQIIQGGGGVFFGSVKNFTAYSNDLVFDIKPLPNDILLVGEYKLSVKTDKTQTTSKEPVNLEITIEGYGNLEDFEPYEVNISGATIYKDKPIFESSRVDDKLHSKAVFKYAILSESDFTIPAFSLAFVDSKTNEIKRTKSNPTEIKVENVGTKEVLVKTANEPTKKQKIKESDSSWFVFLIVGVVIGLLIGYFLPKIKYKKQKESEESPLSQKIKTAKDHKELLRVLIGFIDKKEFAEIITKLEQNPSKDEFKKIKNEAMSAARSTLEF